MILEDPSAYARYELLKPRIGVGAGAILTGRDQTPHLPSSIALSKLNYPSSNVDWENASDKARSQHLEAKWSDPDFAQNSRACTKNLPAEKET